MIQNLFDELKFFHAYPTKELITTAELFGQIINHRVIDGVIINIGYKCILDALTGKEKMNEFGRVAL